MTITITYPSGYSRTHQNMTQKEINTLINSVNFWNEQAPLPRIQITVTD